ncbi:MAG: hypothetical protein CMJ64_12155 [Planctomycetaceae bacterium]|jgi:hypothetical protein|nr:hypothetical protein [Planctomycetaceae bacterium]
MRFFIAGIMQGSRRDLGLHEQDYRARLCQLIETHVPNADVYDPLAEHHESVEYDDDKGREVFYYHNRLCREVDVVVAFVPEASMGTAIEMWEAHEHGRGVVIAITPLAHNWAVKFCSHLVYANFDRFETELASGELLGTIENLLVERAT